MAQLFRLLITLQPHNHPTTRAPTASPTYSYTRQTNTTTWVRAQAGRSCLFVCAASGPAQSELERELVGRACQYPRIRAATTRGSTHKSLSPLSTSVFMSTTRTSCAMPKVRTTDSTTPLHTSWVWAPRLTQVSSFAILPPNCLYRL